MAVVDFGLRASPTLVQKTCNIHQQSNAIIAPQLLWRSKQQGSRGQSCTCGPIVQCEHGEFCCNDGNLQKIDGPCAHYHVTGMSHLVSQQEAIGITDIKVKFYTLS